MASRFTAFAGRMTARMWLGSSMTMAPRGRARSKASCMAVAIDVNPERTWSSIAAADRSGAVELLARRAGTGWVVDALVEFGPKLVVLDGAGPTRSMLAALGDAFPEPAYGNPDEVVKVVNTRRRSRPQARSTTRSGTRR